MGIRMKDEARESEQKTATETSITNTNQIHQKEEDSREDWRVPSDQMRIRKKEDCGDEEEGPS